MEIHWFSWLVLAAVVFGLPALIVVLDERKFRKDRARLLLQVRRPHRYDETVVHLEHRNGNIHVKAKAVPEAFRPSRKP
jgi:hypothetical protein